MPTEPQVGSLVSFESVNRSHRKFVLAGGTKSNTVPMDASMESAKASLLHTFRIAFSQI